MRADDGVDGHRVVLDESSLDFREIEDAAVEEGLVELAEVFADLRASGINPATSSLLYGFECRDGLDITDFLFQRDSSAVDPDVKRRLGVALDRTAIWEDDNNSAVELEPVIDGREQVCLAPSVGYALKRAEQGAGVACLEFSGTTSGDFRAVSSADVSAELFFFSRSGKIKLFWRSLFRQENVPEKHFYALAELAFPALFLASGLSFNNFDGSYQDLRDRVVQLLGAINDHFGWAFKQHKGVPKAVSAELGRFGLDCSPESTRTRAGKRIKQRDVAWEGTTYRCEWHAKLERHRNRIHFSLPIPELGDQIFVGVFHDHLEV